MALFILAGNEQMLEESRPCLSTRYWDEFGIDPTLVKFMAKRNECSLDFLFLLGHAKRKTSEEDEEKS